MTPSAPARVAIRVDSGVRIGSGHVMRCLCLADALARNGAEVLFLCRQLPGSLNDFIERQGFPVERLQRAAAHRAQVERGPDGGPSWLEVPWILDCEQTLPALERFDANWLIVDHYGIGAEWEGALRRPGRRLLAVDDLADRPHDCDVLLDQNYFGPDMAQRYAGLVPVHCRALLGPRYALLQREYAPLRRALPPRSAEPRRVMVFFGGTDATNETCKALRALAAPQLAHLAVDVVVGANHPHPQEVAALAGARPGTTLHRGLSSLAGLMFRADLAVGAGGVATSERMCLQLPSIVITVAANQEGPVASLAGEGALVWVGRAGAVTEADLVLAIERAQKAALPVTPVVDGHGAARVAAAIAAPPLSRLRLARATNADAKLLFDWRNEATAREMSFDATPLAWEAHVRWLDQKLAERDAQIFVGEVDALPVGQARVELRDGELVLSYGVDPDLRGLGFGRALVALAMRRALRPAGTTGWRAHVKAQNEPSKKIFRSLGWHETIEGAEHVFRLGG